MCGGGGNDQGGKGKGKAKDGWGGTGWGSMGGMFGYSGKNPAQSLRDDNNAGMANPSVKNSVTAQAAPTTQVKEVMGGVKTVEAKKTNSIMGATRTAPISKFDEMQEEAARGGIINAADYAKLGTQAIAEAQRRESARDMTHTERAMSEYGKFSQNPNAHPLNRMQSTFNANRKIDGSFLDAVTGKNRTLSMQRAIEENKRGRATDMAATLSSGNTEVDEFGQPKKDLLGSFLDAASLGLSAAFRSPTRIATGLFNMARTTQRQQGLYDDAKAAQVSPTAQRTVASKSSATGFNPVAGMMGGDDSGRHLFVSRAAPAATATAIEEEKATVTTRSRAPRGRSSLILTGPQGLGSRPNTFMQHLFGMNRQEE